MKKIMLLVMALVATTMLVAQDVIVTTNSQKIEAKIIEVSSTQVKYVDFNNQEGPVYVLSVQEILSVQLANGDVKSYEHNVAPVAIGTTTDDSKSVSYIIRTGNRYHYNGMEMRGDVYANFLKTNCSEAFYKYQKGKSLSTVGWILLGVGLGLDVCYTAGVGPYYLGYAVLAFEIACIPTLIVGYTQMHRSADLFNMTCGSNSMASWSVTASGNGIGLALNF